MFSHKIHLKCQKKKKQGERNPIFQSTPDGSSEFYALVCVYVNACKRNVAGKKIVLSLMTL